MSTIDPVPTAPVGVGKPAVARLLIAALLGGVLAVRSAQAAGADLPWRTYEAEGMRTDGAVLGPRSDPYQVETESSGLRCVKLGAAGQYVAFAAAAPANSLVVRYSLPDGPAGGGRQSNLGLYVNGRLERPIALDSRCAWLYGKYPFSNDPAQGKPRHFYDEQRVSGLRIAAGDEVRLVWDGTGADSCIIDLVDLEMAPAPLTAPAGALSVQTFGARGDGRSDDTPALRQGVAAAAARGGVLWVPPGTYRLTGDIVLPSGVTIQGAGMWHTTFVGDVELYSQADRRVRFKLTGRHIGLSDFAILGQLDYRNDQEPNDGIVGAGCADSFIRRIWIEHTKTGIWIYNGTNLRIEGCRFRDLLADGLNLCVGTSGTVVENCSARGTGDDCFAMWPAPSDQGFVGRGPPSGRNVFRRCTGQLPYLANGGAIYGGRDNRIEDCLFSDITAGCGILLSTTFPTSDPSRGIDNNFSGTTVVSGCELLRCGGFDHDWGWRGALQICLDHRSISGLNIRQVNIVDSLSDGVTVVAPGARTGEGTLSEATLESVAVRWTAQADRARPGLWIRADAVGALALVDTEIADIRNDSPHFALRP